MKRTSVIPFDFVIDNLSSLDPVIRPMFGCHAVYIGEKIMLVLRRKAASPNDNGVWVATTHHHHESLRKQFPSLRSIESLGQGETAWQMFPEACDDFEESVLKVCELIRRRDERIGKVPRKKTGKS